MSLDDLYTNYPKEGIQVKVGVLAKTKAGIEAMLFWAAVAAVGFIGWHILMAASPEVRGIASGLGLYSEPSKISINKGRTVGGLNEYQQADNLIGSLNPSDALTDTLKHQQEYCSKPAWWQWGRKYDRRTCLIYTYSMAAEVSEIYPEHVARYRKDLLQPDIIGMSPAMMGAPMPTPPRFESIGRLQNQ
jgi:hypothetical protein